MLIFFEKLFRADFAMKLEDDCYRMLRVKEEASHNTGLKYVDFMYM